MERGTQLGHYEILSPLGAGGMGEVYRARDTKLDRDVAIKVLPEDFATDADRLARFEREAKLLASLNHTNIAAIYGLEDEGDQRYIAMELVEGETLAERISRSGRFEVDEALDVARQIAEALEAAHENGVIHRDLKPANVIVTPQGRAKVLDFGLAKSYEADGSSSDVSRDLSQSPTMMEATRTGVIMGTAAYMSPEQARGQPVDKRADIWAFGAVLYEMLTGTKPFPGDDISQTLARVIERDPDWEALPEGLPPALDTYLRRCLQRDARERVRDMGDVRLALAGAFATTSPTAASAPSGAPPLRLWQRPVPTLLVVLLVAAITGATVWRLMQPDAPAVTRFEVPLRATESFARMGQHVVALSPDGRSIVYVTGDGLLLRSLDEITAAPLMGADGGPRAPFFSPDSQWIGFHAGGQLRKVATTGGAPVMLADASVPSGASWGADDMILYGQGQDGIWRVPGTGGTPEAVITVAAGEAAHGPQMLPGGEWVLYTLRPADAGAGVWDEAQIVVQSLATGERAVLIDRGRDARFVETGHLVYASDGVVFGVAFDLATRQVLGGPVPLVEGVRQAVGNATSQFSVARNGALIYLPGATGPAEGFSLVWVDNTHDQIIDGNMVAATPTGLPRGNYQDVRVSPDGSRVAMAIAEEGNTDVWTWRLDQGPFLRLTFDEAQDDTPLWTPDSSRVVFRSDRDGGGLFWKAADGTGEVERLLESPDRPRPWDWSADGRLVFDQTPGDIGVLTVEGDRTVEMLLASDFTEQGPALSPDARWIAYQSNESGRSEIYVQPFPETDAGKWQVSANSGVAPVWSPDGRRLFFLELEQMMVAEVETEPTFNPRTPTGMFGLQGYAIYAGAPHFDLAPDGERFLMRSARRQSTGAMIFVEHWVEELKARIPVSGSQ